jgi:hypothetical protein
MGERTREREGEEVRRTGRLLKKRFHRGERRDKTEE